MCFRKNIIFIKKNLDVEDNKIFLKSNYCIDCVKEEDIWFKFISCMALKIVIICV